MTLEVISLNDKWSALSEVQYGQYQGIHQSLLSIYQIETAQSQSTPTQNVIQSGQ